MMERYKKFSLKKFIASLCFNAALLLVALLVFVPFFEENDDSNIAMIVEGAFGVREWHVIYPNAILGKIYVVLQSVVPYVRWHVVLQYVFIFTGYVFAVYVLSKHKRGTFIAAVAALSTFYELYVSIQYTKTAAFVCSVAYILLFEYVRNVTSLSTKDRIASYADAGKNRENTLFLIVAAILIIYGILLRPESLFIAAVPTLGVGILELLRTKNIKMYIVVFLPIAVIFAGLHFANSYIYSASEEWSDFMKYNKARMQLNDYRYDIFDFTKYGDKLERLSVSENDALAILTYQYGDDKIFSYERFKEIRDEFPAREFGYTIFANLYENLIEEIGKSYVLLIGFAGVILVLFSSIITDRSKSSPGYIKDARRKLYSMIIIGVSCFASVVYFQYSGRYSHRLIGAVVIPTVFLAGYIVDSIYIRDNESKIIFGGNKNDITAPLSIVFLVVLMGLNGVMYVSNTRNALLHNTTNEAVLREIEEISRDKASLYVGDTFTFQNVFRYEVFKPFEIGELDNFVTCGSWYINSPITKQVTGKYGYENPFDALRSETGNVYLVDNGGVECKTLFLTEHYDKVYTAKKLENRGGLDVYHIISLDKSGNTEE